MTIFDPGLQPERTLLAWRRTSLAFGAGSAVAAHFTAEIFGVAGMLAGLAGVGLAGAAYVVAWRRYHRANTALAATQALALDAVPLALAATGTAVLGVACLAFVLVSGAMR